MLRRTSLLGFRTWLSFARANVRFWHLADQDGFRSNV